MKTKALLIFLGGLLTVVIAITLFWKHDPTPSETTPRYVLSDIASTSGQVESAPRLEVIAENLDIPWEILFLPDGEIVVTERPGTLFFLKAGVEVPLSDISVTGEGGLLGAALHPDYSQNNYLYLYKTTEDNDGLLNRVNRYVVDGTTVTFDRTIIDAIPGARYHDGGRILFGPDGHLYIAVGDATDRGEAQNPNSLHGTILRVTTEGEPAPGNPFGTMVYSYGHRNPQGLAFDADGNLWSTEHGRSVPLSGYDELNRIEAGGNYGWPDSQGDEVASGTVAPARHSGADVTWAPASLAYHAGSLYFAGLRGETLYEGKLENGKVVDWEEHLVGEFGRLRTVSVGPDGLLYLTTSNRDGRGNTPAENDDKIIRINSEKL